MKRIVLFALASLALFAGVAVHENKAVKQGHPIVMSNDPPPDCPIFGC